MSKLSFRARALDPSKPMPIYLAEELPDLPEYSAINRAVPQMPSGMEKEEESEHHLQRAICTGLIIPTPEVFLTDQEFYDRNYPPNYKMPRQMIHMQPLGLEQDIPDYDMDSGDEIWVNSQSRRLNLTPLKFEQMMDRLEKSSGQTVITLNEAKALLKEDDEVSIAVYDYWLNKRLKMQHPLILSVKTENRAGAAANNPYLAFRRRTEKMQTRKNRKNDETSYEKMLKLRRDLSRAVTLLEMVKRREKTKREQLHLSIEIFEKRYQVRDFNGSLLSELSSSIKNSRPAFAPLYTNQYSHHSSMAQSGIMSSSSSSHHYSSSQYLNSTGVVSSPIAAGAIKRELDSGSRKEKRQYKKRKHKLQREKQYSVQSSSPAAVESTIESEEEDLAGAHLAGSEGEDEGLYAFRRNKNCEYHKPLTRELGNWPWESKADNGLADPKYRFTLASIRHPRPRCIGFARRRLGRGGRIILDRISTNMDDVWSQLDYTIFDSKTNKTAKNVEQLQQDDDNNSRDPMYLSASTEPIKCPAASTWNQHPIRIISPLTATNTYNNNGLNNLSSNIESNSISNVSNYLLNNKEIKREQIDADDVDWTSSMAMTTHQYYQQPPNQSQSDIVVDLVRTHCKNSNISNRSINNNNNANYTNDNIRTIANSNNDKVNVIKTENNTVIKQEPVSDINILDDENMNLARLSSFINANKSTMPKTVGSETYVKSELSRAESFDLLSSISLTNSNFINNCNKLSRSSSLPQDLCNNSVKSEDKRTDQQVSVIDTNDVIYKEFLDEIRKDWLHFRPKTPEKSPSPTNSEFEEHIVEFSEQTPIAIEMQKLGASPPSSVFSMKIDNDPLFVTTPFAFSDLVADEQLMNSATTDSSNSGIDFNISGDSLNELNLSLGEEDNEKMLDNILQECQIDDLKALNQTTNFWNGILDDGGLLDVIDEKKPPVTDIKENVASEFLINGCGLAEEKDSKRPGKRKPSPRCRIGSSTFSISNSSTDDKFFRKEETKADNNPSIKIEPPEDILASPPAAQNMASTSNGDCCTNITQGITAPIGSANHTTIIGNLNPNNTSKFLIKTEPNQVPTSMNQNSNAVITLANIKLDNDLGSGTLVTHPSGTLMTDAGGSTVISNQPTSITLQPKQQQQHILVQQITPNSQIINVSNAGLTVNDGGGTIVLAGSSPNKRHINGPTDRNAIQNILKQSKLINRKFHISQQQTISAIKQDDDSSLSSSPKQVSHKDLQQAGSYIKMSPYPVVVSELNVQQQNSLSTSAFAVASNHNYSLPTSAQQITIIGQQQQGNKIILNTSGAGGAQGNLTIPIQDLQNKIHYNQMPTSNIKVNLVTSTGIQQGSLVVDSKNSDIVKPSSTQQTHGLQQQQQPQQRVKFEKALNMYIDQDQKRVLYTKFINLASLQNKNSGQTVQVIPGTGQLINKTHTAQRLANAQAIVTNIRSLPVSNQVVASAGAGVNAVVGASSSDVGHKQQNNSNDTLSATTVTGGINLNTTNR